jgi:mycothiol synthase
MSDRAIPVAHTGVIVRTERDGDRLDVVVEAARPGALDATDDATIAAVGDAIGALRDGRTTLRLVADHPPTGTHPLPDEVADAIGLDDRRDLYELRRPLPVPADHPERGRGTPLPLRPFDPAADGPAWLRQNNRAFVDHPDQGDQRPDTLAATLAEPWVDLEGFLVADDPDRPGELAGSCWTRRHPATDQDPELGEIFVIGVDPSHHGHGLGAQLVLAGLDHLSRSGTTTAMLYVEATNDPARRLYERLGFEPHRVRRIASEPS